MKRVIDYEMFAIFLVDERANELVLKTARQIAITQIGDQLTFIGSSTLVATIITSPATTRMPRPMGPAMKRANDMMVLLVRSGRRCAVNE